MDKSEEAKGLLVHYFQLIADRAGVSLNSDCFSEMRSIVDLIVDAAVEKSRK